jgi:hypothetical protein
MLLLVECFVYIFSTVNYALKMKTLNVSFRFGYYYYYDYHLSVHALKRDRFQYFGINKVKYQ